MPSGGDELDAFIKQWAEHQFGIDHAPPAAQKRRRALVKQWLMRRATAWAAFRKPIDAELSALQPTERELRDYCLSVASNPSSISSADELMTYFLARQLLKLKPEWWSPQEIADLIDKLVDNKMEVTAARREVAEVLGLEIGAVARAHQRLGRHKGKTGRPRKR